MGRTFDEVAEQNAAAAARAGMSYVQITSLEHIAKSNYAAGSFLACLLDGEPHALAMPETIEDSAKPTLKRGIEGGACVFRAEYFSTPEYPLVHIGLGLPVRFMEGDKVAFGVVENVANFVEANFQDWVSAIEIKKYTLVDVFASDFTLIGSGRTDLEPKVLAEIVESVNKANNHFKEIPEGARDYSKAVKEFYQRHPGPFIWSSQARAMA